MFFGLFNMLGKLLFGETCPNQPGSFLFNSTFKKTFFNLTFFNSDDPKTDISTESFFPRDHNTYVLYNLLFMICEKVKIWLCHFDDTQLILWQCINIQVSKTIVLLCQYLKNWLVILMIRNGTPLSVEN